MVVGVVVVAAAAAALVSAGSWVQLPVVVNVRTSFHLTLTPAAALDWTATAICHSQGSGCVQTGTGCL